MGLKYSHKEDGKYIIDSSNVKLSNRMAELIILSFLVGIFSSVTLVKTVTLKKTVWNIIDKVCPLLPTPFLMMNFFLFVCFTFTEAITITKTFKNFLLTADRKTNM